MRKKVVMCMLALSMCFCGVAGTSVGVFADEYVNSVGSVAADITNETKVGQDTVQGQQSEYYEAIKEEVDVSAVNVYATVASEFEVVIPKTVILDGESKTGAYTVDVNGDIAGDQAVTVTPDTSFAMKQEGKDDVTATVTQDKTSWAYNEMDTDATGEISAQDLTAGSWNGTFNFAIALEGTDDAA